MSDSTRAPSLHTPEQMSEKLLQNPRIRVSAERLVELAEAGYLPHYRWSVGVPIDGQPAVTEQLMFQLTEVRKWFVDNALTRHDGAPFPSLKVIVMHPDRRAQPQELPPQLALMSDTLFRMSDLAISGVYFLVRDGALVYIGQSVAVGSRISNHPVKYDDAFVLPVPRGDLDTVEGAFIRHFQPPENRNNGRGLILRDSQILTHYGALEPAHEP